ncbi:MAG: hypothetical protein V4727_13930 [Verrucomicrobiota bacterium]
MAWYKDALDLDFQFHVMVDGASVHTFFYNRSNQSWSPGLHVSEDILADSEKTLDLGRRLIKQVEELKGRHLGVVIHVADEFATAEIKPKLNNPGALNDLRQVIYENPREALEDSSVSPDQASWRVMPYPAAGSQMIATTIRISRRLDPFVTTLRNLGNDENFPIITHAVSAPLVAMMSLPAVIKTSTNKPFVAVLQYPWFTAMAFFNEHSDLRLIRSLQHRGQRCPANFWSSLVTTNTSLEFVNPDIYLLPLGDQVDVRISEDLRRNFPSSHIESVYFPEVSPLPAWAPEPNLCISGATATDSGETESHTFGVLRKEGWFLQDFLTQSTHDQGLFPSRTEIRLLRYFNIAKRVIYTALVLLILSMVLEVYGVITKPEWKFNDDEARIVKQKMMMLGAERTRLEHWNILLDDRAKAWATMEMAAQLFPEKSGILLKSLNLSVRTEPAPKQPNIGFIKEWKISGLARPEALDMINVINTPEGITAKFGEISKITGDGSFDPTPTTRSLAISMKIEENTKFQPRHIEDVVDSDATSYSYTFELSIIQRFEATDPLAIPKVKAP